MIEPQQEEPIPASTQRLSSDPIDPEIGEMMNEGGGSIPNPEIAEESQPYSRAPHSTQYVLSPHVESTAETPVGKLQTWLEKWSQKWGRATLERLVARKGFLARSMQNVPSKMHRTARQSELVLELIDDFRTGRYRDIPWRSIALLSGVLLYTVSPADVIPDTLPLVGGLDDVSLVALATRLVRKDLAAYCEFKGYDVDAYFGNRD